MTPDSTEREMSPPISRRSVLSGAAGVGGLALMPANARGSLLSDLTSEVGLTTPHTDATFEALADAIVPRTPELAERLGEEHEPGGLDIGLEKFLINAFNKYFPVPQVASTGDAGTLPGAPLIAGLLDVMATELLLRGRNHDLPNPTRFPGGLTFASLSRKDRFRALALAESREYQIEFDSERGLFGTATDIGGSDSTDGGESGLLGTTTDDLVELSDTTDDTRNGLSGLLETPTGDVVELTHTTTDDVVELTELDVDLSENDFLDAITDVGGLVGFIIMGINAFTAIGYYTEWSGYGETKTDDPTDREFSPPVQSWKQTDYPGPAWGYAALRGYEVADFKEGEY